MASHGQYERKKHATPPPKTLLAIPLLAAVGSAWAAADATTLPPGWYVGASVGQSRFHTDPGNLSNSLASQAGTPVGGSLGDTDTGYKLRAGYQFTPNLAVEGGYVDFGKVDFNGASAAGPAGGQVKASGVNLDLVGRMPVAPNWAVLGKAGLM